MKTKFISLIVGLGLVFSFAFSFLPSGTVAAASCGGNDASFLGFPVWYRGVSTEANGKCIVTFNGSSDQLGSFIWKIGLNIVEIAIRVVALIAVGYILYGGFTYLTSNGSSDKAAKGLSLIMSASIGLVISIASIAIVNTLFGIIPSGATASDGIYQLGVSEVIGGVMNVVYWIAGALAVIMIIVSGIKFITSGSNPSGLQKARSSLINSVIGLVVIILAFTLTQIILGFFK